MSMASHDDKSLTDFDLRRLAVENALATGFADSFNPFLTVESLKKLMVAVIPDHAKLRSLFGIIRKWVPPRNIFELDCPAKDFCRIDVDEDEWLPTFHPDYLAIRDELLIALNERINACDDLTRISAINWKSQLYHRFNDFNPEIFVKPFLHHNGVLFHISGVMGSGKTDMGLKITENLLKHDFVVITNIFSLDAKLLRFTKEIDLPIQEGRTIIPNFYRVIRMTDLLLKCIDCLVHNKNIVLVWDEVSTFYHRQQAMKKSNVEMSKFLRLIRKFNLNIIFIEQIDEGLATVANVMLAAKIQKESQRKLQYSTRFLERNYNEFLDDVPKTSIHFLTKDIAGFKLDVSFDDLLKRVESDEGFKIDTIENYLIGIQNREQGLFSLPQISNPADNNITTTIKEGQNNKPKKKPRGKPFEKFNRAAQKNPNKDLSSIYSKENANPNANPDANSISEDANSDANETLKKE